MNRIRSLAIALAVVALIAVSMPEGQALILRARAVARRSMLILTGGLVDVGGLYLRLECHGRGSPTVVMDSGLTFSRTAWEPVATRVSQFTRVCTYDRAGLGQSDPPTRLRTSQDVSDELHTLLTKAGVATPYVLVGHSFGGLTVRLYAAQYPNEVAGLVLVDASHEDQAKRIRALLSPTDQADYWRHEAGDNLEHIDVVESSEQVRAASPLAPMPVVILTAGHPETEPSWPQAEMAQLHTELQADLTRLVPRAEQVIAARSGHFIQDDEPGLVIAEIRRVVEAARRGETGLR